MRKIPTIFKRDWNTRLVVNEVASCCEWVFACEGIATEKLDGTNVRLTVRGGAAVRVEKRRNPTKTQKSMGIIDPWYVDANADAPEDKWILQAAINTSVGSWPDGEHSCEALGPKIQGNPLGLIAHRCVPFNLSPVRHPDVPRTFEGLREWLGTADSLFSPGHAIEGIVFHHPDGRRAKIKRKDFGL